jgi:hypothetical protein
MRTSEICKRVVDATPEQRAQLHRQIAEWYADDPETRDNLQQLVLILGLVAGSTGRTLQ